MAENERVTDSIEESYLATLDRALIAATPRSGTTLLSVLRSVQGVFPTLVMERLKKLGRDTLLHEPPLSAPSEEPTVSDPELHPLDFEWYFTPDCADQVSELLISKAGDILCLAAPSVACAIGRRGKPVVLLDNNPLVKLRLPSGSSNLQFTVCNLYDRLPLDNSFAVVFFDAPWYIKPVTYWMWQASNIIASGGTMAFSLFPSLLRPGADEERSQVLAQARAIGEVQVLEDVLAYDTPLFEREALAHGGIRITSSWRRADLVVVTVNKKVQPLPPFPAPPDEAWETFLIGKQVVKLRKLVSAADNFFLAPVEGLVDYVFPTVSMRDPRRTQIDLWTSRNRVARVGNRSLVAHALGRLENGKTVAEVADSSEVASISIADREAFLTSLCLILEIPSEERDVPTHNRPAIRRFQ